MGISIFLFIVETLMLIYLAYEWNDRSYDYDRLYDKPKYESRHSYRNAFYFLLIFWIIHTCISLHFYF